MGEDCIEEWLDSTRRLEVLIPNWICPHCNELLPELCGNVCRHIVGEYVVHYWRDNVSIAQKKGTTTYLRIDRRVVFDTVERIEKLMLLQ